jgi:hypothetical protein
LAFETELAEFKAEHTCFTSAFLLLTSVKLFLKPSQDDIYFYLQLD